MAVDGSNSNLAQVVMTYASLIINNYSDDRMKVQQAIPVINPGAGLKLRERCSSILS